MNEARVERLDCDIKWCRVDRCHRIVLYRLLGAMRGAEVDDDGSHSHAPLGYKVTRLRRETIPCVVPRLYRVGFFFVTL
jgi:hypothetical protein